MDKIILTRHICDIDLLCDLINFYQRVPEFGPKNRLANLDYLIWKHLNNPCGKSWVFIAKNTNGKVLGVIFLQKRKFYTNCNEFDYWLACDLGIDYTHRNLNIFFKLWNFLMKNIEKNATIYHSSNKYSEPFYNHLEKHKLISTLEPYILLPRISFTKKFESKTSAKFTYPKDSIYKKWRNSSFNNFKITVYEDIRYAVYKIGFFKIIIIIDYLNAFISKSGILRLIKNEKTPIILYFTNVNSHNEICAFKLTKFVRRFNIYQTGFNQSLDFTQFDLNLEFLDIL